MVRSWRDRLWRFGTGFVAGAFVSAGFRDHGFWSWLPIIVCLGLLTADSEEAR